MKHLKGNHLRFAFFMADSIKALENYRLKVLGAPYGVDRHGHEFHAGTDFGDLPVVPVIFWHGWGEDDGERIGWAYKAERDAYGQWYDVWLDPLKETARRIWEAAKIGVARASSDAIRHLVRPQGILGKPGRVDRWIIGALSLMDQETSDFAVNPRAIALPAVKAYCDQLDILGEACDAAKAGAVFAKRNRERIQQMKRMLDEMLAEFPENEEDESSQAKLEGSAEGVSAKSKNPVSRSRARKRAVLNVSFNRGRTAKQGCH